MQISKFLLKKKERTFQQHKRKQLQVYRVILFLCSAFPILLRHLNSDISIGSFDPAYIRYIFACSFGIAFICTYLLHNKRLVSFIVLGNVYVYSFYLIFLNINNSFSSDYVLEFILFVVVGSRAFNNKILLLIYFITLLLGYSIVSIIFFSNPLQQLYSITFLLLFVITIIVFFDSKSKLDEQENLRAILLQATFNESPDAIFLIDPRSLVIKECNVKALTLFGFEQKDAIKEQHIQSIIPFPVLSEKLHYKVRTKEESPSAMEFELSNSQGKKFFGSIAFNVLKVKKEEFILLRVSDITDRVKYKKSVEDNRKMLRQLIDLLPHSIFLKDHLGRFLFVNKIFIEHNDLLESEVLGKTDYQIFRSPQALQFMKDDQEVIHSGKIKFIENHSSSGKDGKVYIYQTTKMPFYGEDEDTPGLLGISIDISERIRDKQLLEENRKMLMQILNLLPHNIFLKDSAGQFLFVNEKAAEHHMLKPEELLGKTYFDIYSKEQALKYVEEEQHILQEQKPRIISEEISLDRKGKTQVKTVIKMPFPLEATRETGILGIIIDITDFKLNEKALKESELKYKMLMEQASDGIYLSDHDGNILEANPKACDMFGYAWEEFMHLNIKKLIDPLESKDTPLKGPEMRDKQSIILERRFVKKNGSSFTVELSAKLLDNGRHQAIIRDITERKRIERVLKENEKKFRSLIENSSDVIIIVGESLKVKFASPSIERILGFPFEDVAGKSPFGIIHQEDQEKISKIFSDSLMEPGKKIGTEELRLSHKNGQYLYFEIVAVNLLNDTNINGIIINCHDITKRKVTELELLNTNFELDSFVYKASHDLKAPLRSVLGLIKLAKFESQDPNLNVYLDMMNKSVLSLDSFIKDLTQFSRNSRVEVEAKLINFNEIIEEALSNLLYMDKAGMVKIVKNLKMNEPFYSDTTRLGTIINNLLSNAFKYHRFENNNPYINIQIEADHERALIILEDNGIGIDPLHINRIFDMFYRAADTSYGSGLGLYIVKNAVVKLNGSIEVDSTLKKGTTFKINIPNLINKIIK